VHPGFVDVMCFVGKSGLNDEVMTLFHGGATLPTNNLSDKGEKSRRSWLGLGEGGFGSVWAAEQHFLLRDKHHARIKILR
jgi:hypothetical protein